MEIDQENHVVDGYLTINYCHNDKTDHAHFLTHIETGLSSEDLNKIISAKAPTIYTSDVNAYILRNYFKCDRHITIVEFGKTYQIYTGRGTFFMFTCIRSFYNCGSMILIARGNFGTFIYTGYSSINLESLMSVNIIKEIAQNQSLTRLYLDCTFYKVPGVVASLDDFKKLTLHFFKKRPNHFFIYVPVFGLEDLMAQIADGLNEKIVVDKKRMALIQFLGLTENFTLDKSEGRLHIISEGLLKRKWDILSSQLVVIKVAKDFTEIKNSYMNNGKVHFFTLFPHASDEECTEIIFKMKPKEFIPINCQSLSQEKSILHPVDTPRSNGAESNKNNLEISFIDLVISEINEKIKDAPSISMVESEDEGTSQTGIGTKSVNTEEVVNISCDHYSEANEKSIGTVRRNNTTSLNSSKKIKRRRNLVSTDVKKKNGVSKLRQMCSNITLMTTKKQFAHTNSRNTTKKPEVKGNMIIENNALLSSLKLNNECELEEQNDCPSTSSNDKDNVNTDISITNGEDKSEECVNTVELSEVIDTNYSGALISENTDNVIDKETENNAILGQPKYNVLNEHTYARQMCHYHAADSSAPLLSDEESNSECNSRTQLIIPELVDDDTSSQCNGESDLNNNTSSDEETVSDSLCEMDDNTNQSDSSTNLMLTNEGTGTSENNLAGVSENNRVTANISEESTKPGSQVENEEEEDSSDDCIIQENHPDVIELSDNSNDSFEQCKTKESNDNREGYLSSDSNVQLSPSSNMLVNKCMLSQGSSNGKAHNDSGIICRTGSNNKMFYLMKLDTFLKETSSSSFESVRTPTIVMQRGFDDSSQTNNLPLASLQASSNEPINMTSSNNVCSNSLKPRIIYLNPLQAVANNSSHLKKVSPQSVGLDSPYPKAVIPSTSKGLHCQHQTGLKFKTFVVKPYVLPKRNTAVPPYRKFELVAQSALKNNTPVSSNVQSAESNPPKSLEGSHLPTSTEGLSRNPIIPIYNIDSHSDCDNSNSQDSNDNSEILTKSLELTSMTEGCSSNATGSQNLEDFRVEETIIQPTENINKVMPGTIKIKKLSELVADLSYLKAVNDEPPALKDTGCQTPIVEDSNITKTLNSGEIVNKDDSDELLDYNVSYCGKGLNSNAPKTNELACDKSSVNVNNSSNFNAYPTKSVLEIKSPGSPRTERSESVTATSIRNLTMISSKISKRKRKPKRSVWMKFSTKSNKRRQCNKKSWMYDSSRNPIDGIQNNDLSGKPVNSTKNSYPKVYQNFHEFFANHNPEKAECRLLNQFNISESYVKIIPHFRDTSYEYDSVKNCYIPSAYMGKEVTMTLRRKLLNQDGNHSLKCHTRNQNQSLSNSSVRGRRSSQRLKNDSFRNRSTEKFKSDGAKSKLCEEVRKRRLLKRQSLIRDGANSRKLLKGSTRKTNKSNDSKKIEHGKTVCHMTGAERAKLIALADSVPLVGDFYKCPRCEYVTKWKKNVKRHILAIHIDKKPYQCSESFNKAKKMSSVKSNIGVTQIHNADVCNSSIENYQYSQFDDQCHNDNDLSLLVKRVNAESSHGSDGRKTVIIRCLRSNGDKKSELIIRDTKADRAELFAAINNLQPVDGVYRCPRCKYLSSWRKNVKRHVAGMHIIARSYKSFKCMECNFDAKNKNQLTSHIVLAHMKDKPFIFRLFSCHKCDFGSVNEHEFNRHLELFHKESIEDNARRRISTWSDLENEITETDSPDGEIISCMDTNAKEELLDAANAILFDNDVYKCPSCEYSSKRNGKVIRHIASVHILNAAYKCPGCSYQGKDKQSLISHIIFIHMN